MVMIYGIGYDYNYDYGYLLIIITMIIIIIIIDKNKAEKDLKAMKSQSKNLQQEYDRLMTEFDNATDKKSSSKKDD